jgi:hypothetical protein
MSPDALINGVRRLYAAGKKARAIAPGVYRGTVSPVSAQAEDRFGRYVKDALPEDVEIWIDPHISCPADGRRRTVRPDICVVRNETIVMIFELKMDLGFLRDTFLADAKKRAAALKTLRGVKARCTINNEERQIGFSGRLRCNFVVFCDGNISAKKMQRVKKGFAAKNPPGRLFILSRGAPLNGPGKPKVNEDDFDRLTKELNGLKSAKRNV